MAATTGMTTPRTFAMATGAGFTTVGFTILHYSIAQIDDAETIWAGTLHLSHGSHGKTPTNVPTHLNT